MVFCLVIPKMLSKVKIFDGIGLHTIPQNPLPLWEVKFSNSFFYNSETRFGLLSKNCLHKVVFFFKNLDRNMAKIRENLLPTYFYELTLNLEGFSHFSPCSPKYFLKRRPLCVDSFSRAIQIWSQNCKKMNLKISLPIGVRDFGVWCAARSHRIFSLLTTFLKLPDKKPRHILVKIH